MGLFSLFGSSKSETKRSDLPCIEVIDVFGTISGTPAPSLSPKYLHYDTLETIRDSIDDKQIVGALVRINSPGGTAGASAELALELKRLAEKKPVVATISDIACSGAYFAASACNYIVASPMAIVGSIGVIINSPDVTALSEKLGASMRTFKSVPNKDIGSAFRPMSTEEEEILTDLTKKGHSYFEDFVIAQRGIIKGTIATDGRVFSATEAKELRLIDALGTYEDAVDEVLSRAGLKREDVDFEFSGSEESSLNRLLGMLEGCSELREMLAGGMSMR